MRHLPGQGLVALSVAVLVSACGGDDPSGGGIPASFEAETGGPTSLSTLRTTDAVGRLGPDGHAFTVERRTPRIVQYPCTACHTDPVTMGDRPPDAHADIQPVHPAEVGASCETCHDPANPGDLRLQNGQTATLDEAYRVCAQCHYSQADDWAGGGHGKRIAGWRGPRVVMSCTACHDPHAPAFDQRIPFPGPNIPRTGGRRR